MKLTKRGYEYETMPKGKIIEHKVKEKKVLNLGCGLEMEGTSRIDVVKTPATTEVGDLNEKLP